MSDQHIRKSVQDIKNLIGDGRIAAAFDRLRQFIDQIDGVDVQNEEERSLQNQVIALRARFTQIEKQQQLNPDIDDTDFNQLLQSLLQLIDQAEQVALDRPEHFKATAQLTTAQPTYTATIPIEKTQKASADGSDQKGCLLAFANRDTNINIEIKSFQFLRPLLGMASVLLLGITFFFLWPSTDQVISVDEIPSLNPTERKNIPTVQPVDSTAPPELPPLGKDAKAMGFSPESTPAAMADYLSDPRSEKSKRFALNQITFSKNKVALNQQGKKELNQIADLLKAYPKAYLDIFGLMTDDEEASYKGNKEITLDEVRARTIFSYLKNRGVNPDQLSFEGEGTETIKSIKVRLSK
ncbi:MAG: OmpA family protein [Bacteroidota bacterium]